MQSLMQTLNRAKQTVDEKIGSAAQTPLDPELQTGLDRMDDVRQYTEKILSAVEAYIQPDPTQRLLPGMVQEGQSKSETVGNEMGHLATRLGASQGYGKALQKGSEAFHKVGAAEKEWFTAVQQKFIVNIKQFLNDMKALESERKILNTKRLDMDVLKAKAAKTTNDANLAGDLKRAQDSFEEQATKVKGLIKVNEGKMNELQNHLKAFAQAHADYSKKVQGIMGDLQKAL